MAIPSEPVHDRGDVLRIRGRDAARDLERHKHGTVRSTVVRRDAHQAVQRGTNDPLQEIVHRLTQPNERLLRREEIVKNALKTKPEPTTGSILEAAHPPALRKRFWRYLTETTVHNKFKRPARSGD